MPTVLTHPETTAQRPHWLAGVGGFEPPYGGIKIQVVRIISQLIPKKCGKFDLSAFRRLTGISERRDKGRAVIVAGLLCPLEAEEGSNVFGRCPNAALRSATTCFRCN